LAGNSLVNKSAKLSDVCTLAICTMPAATASLTLWYAIELCFFFNVDVGMVALVITDLLSPKIFAGQSMGIPNMRSLYRRASTISMQIRIAMNSEPKVDVSIVLCALENHIIGAQLRYSNIPVCER